MGRACCRYGDSRGAYRVWGGGPKGKGQLGIPRRRWKDNIRLDFQVVEWGHGLD